jgi:glyoxylase-like metal-dependent hydrolase (beta-lactamase superfamily II)
MKICRLPVGELSTNCYVVVSRDLRAFLIDPGDEAEKIKGFLSKNKIEAKFIVHTHGHFDHIKADAALGLPVYIHENDADLIRHPEKNPMIELFGPVDAVTPKRLLKEGDKIILDELTFSVIHTPGHTSGGICLFGDGVLFSGDTLFKDGVGRTDFPGASSEELEVSLRKIAQLKGDTKVYPGHGPETTVARELDLSRMF